MNNKLDYIVFPGRFEPLHNAHLETIKLAAKLADKIIIVIGSIGGARIIRNPFTYAERVGYISATLNAIGLRGKYIIRGVRDYFYSDNMWVSEVQSVVREITGDDATIGIIGTEKDAAGCFLHWFPMWQFIDSGEHFSYRLNATDIRKVFFDSGHVLENLVHEEVAGFLYNFKTHLDYPNLVRLNRFITEYKASWQNAPYPPTIVCTDAVVVCAGHLLLIRRKAEPGEGLLALPGGHLEQDETIDQCVIRELREETRIKVPAPVLLGSVVGGPRVFDHPNRSEKGRVISHAYLIQLKDTELPKVKGGDDAAKAFWMPLSEVNSNFDQFHDDHAQIIECMVTRA